MYLVNVERHFDAAHYLRGYQGKCENLHGHRYRVAVRLKAASNDNAGMAYDFTLLKKELERVLEKYDHRCLNEVPPFDSINTSAENIARTIFGEMKKELDSLPDGISLDAVTVWESPESWVEYQPD
jgi:6-pyruvoyltetrahydropterin/6-carboxytetrahydropterin synthase